jgi:hypothetical protein
LIAGNAWISYQKMTGKLWTGFMPDSIIKISRIKRAKVSTLNLGKRSQH